MQLAGLLGLSAVEAAQAMFDTPKLTASEKEKARRRLEALTKSGHLEVVDQGDQAATNRPDWASDDLHAPLQGTF